MNKQSILLNRKRNSKSNSKRKENKQEASNCKVSFLQETYSFMNNIKQKIIEINEIRSNQIEGILTNTKKTLNKNPNKCFDDNKEDFEESECCIIYQENYDTNKHNYNNDRLRIESFDSSKDCIICFKKIEIFFEFKCGHKVCNKCGFKLIRIKNACPICRQSI